MNRYTPYILGLVALFIAVGLFFRWNMWGVIVSYWLGVAGRYFVETWEKRNNENERE